MGENKIILVYTACKNNTEAKRISKVLIEKKLIGCVNMFPMESMYRWKGKIENSKEIVFIVKTTSKNYDSVKNVISKMHSYETPSIMKINATVNEKYYRWLIDEMN